MFIEGAYYKLLGRLSDEDLATLQAMAGSQAWGSIGFRKQEMFVGNKAISVPAVITPHRTVLHEEEGNLIRSVLPALFEDTVVFHGYLGLIPAGGSVGMHPDRYRYHQLSHRVHVPLFTHEAVKFSWKDGITTHLEKGVIYEINNLLPHSVENKSDTDRIHLILDFISPKSLLDYTLLQLDEFLGYEYSAYKKRFDECPTKK